MVERKMAPGPGDKVVVIFSGQLSSSNALYQTRDLEILVQDSLIILYECRS
jgi:hypothetical protein